MTNWQTVKKHWVERWPDWHPIILEYLWRQDIDVESVDNVVRFNYESDLHDPFLLPDMAIAVERIITALHKDQKIVIFGDYDADGLPGIAILDAFFKKIEFNNYELQVPDRNIDGFGLKDIHIERLITGGCDLVITVDCGSASIGALELAKDNNLDVIVTDHHEVPDVFPADKVIALVNPMVKDSSYPYKNICGAAVVFKLVQALLDTISNSNQTWSEVLGNKCSNIVPGWEKWLLDLVAIATVGDMMPLRDENRALVHYGLQVLNKTRNYGLRALIDNSRLERGSINETDIGFRIAPRINAASRVGDVQAALDLLTATDPLSANRAAGKLETLNKERKNMVTQMVKQAHKILGPKQNYDSKVIVIGNPEWLPGVCGLLASRLVEEYGVSAFVWGRGPGTKLKGSCRAASGDNVYDLMSQVSEDILEGYGGHIGAGGFVLRPTAADELQPALEKIIHNQVAAETNALADHTSTKNLIDLKVVDVTQKLLDEIDRLAPYGHQFPSPQFQIQAKATLQSFGKSSEHLKIRFIDGVTGIKWRSSIDDLEYDASKGSVGVSVVCQIEYDSYIKSPRLLVHEITLLE